VTIDPQGEAEMKAAGAVTDARLPDDPTEAGRWRPCWPETGEFSSAQDLHARLKESGEKVGLATIYSQLRTPPTPERSTVVRGDSGETLFRRCDLVSHHPIWSVDDAVTPVELDATGGGNLAAGGRTLRLPAPRPCPGDHRDL